MPVAAAADTVAVDMTAVDTAVAEEEPTYAEVHGEVQVGDTSLAVC